MDFLGAQHRMSANPSGVPFIRLWLMVVGVLPFIVLEAGLPSGSAQSEITDVSPEPAAKYITAAFDRYPLVASWSGTRRGRPVSHRHRLKGSDSSGEDFAYRPRVVADLV
jgi:hypothetical protein